jgi:hypothetical protein
MRRRAKISERRFGLGTALVLGKSLDKVRDCLDLAEGLECSNHARQRPSFCKPYEQIKYTRLTQSCRCTGCRIDHGILADALNGIGNIAWSFKEFDQHIIGFEPGQSPCGQASCLK